MSTRCVVTVIDGMNTFHIYRHNDGYPDTESGVLATIPLAFEFAWSLPRFEASDFAAALIRAWKKTGGGDIYCIEDFNSDLHDGLAYRYEIRQIGGTQSLKVGVFIKKDDRWEFVQEVPIESQI